MVTAASDIPLEFGADPAMGGCLGVAGDASVAMQQMFSRRSSCRIIFEVCSPSEMAWWGWGAGGCPWKRETSRKRLTGIHSQPCNHTRVVAEVWIDSEQFAAERMHIGHFPAEKFSTRLSEQGSFI